MTIEQVKTTKGHRRQKHIDNAESYIIQGRYDEAKGELFNFIETINEFSDAGTRLKKELDETFIQHTQLRTKYEKHIQETGFIEQSINGNKIFNIIDINIIQDIKIICKNLADDYKLFDDESEIDYPL